jgi:potassium uptake TrkH family protein
MFLSKKNGEATGEPLKEGLKRFLGGIAFWISLGGVGALIYDIGFHKTATIEMVVNWIYLLSLFSGVIFVAHYYLLKNVRPKRSVRLVDAFLILLYLLLIIEVASWIYLDIQEKNLWLNFAIITIFVRELSAFRIEVKKQYLNPAQLFIFSFMVIIAAGTFLLMLPRSTVHGITFVDALFTSTSAVCVTGLAVVDTGQFFTPLGQTVIMILIQAGGIGIMTFTSYFGFFFKGSASYQNRLMIRDMTNSERIADVFSTLKKILLITFLIELTGAMVIYTSLDHGIVTTLRGRIFFSLFHSVSAFCNAGFSTLTNNFNEPGFQYNYLLHLAVAFLIILGGIGFPIVLNAMSYVKHLVMNHLFNRHRVHSPWVIGLNTRIVLLTTLSLLAVGTTLFYLLEYKNTLADHHGLGKLVTAFFGATTPRTAGFNSVDMTALNLSTVLVTLFLMWIGASPGSTGGGIKTSTFAIAILNFLSIARGKDRVEIFNREVSPISGRRAFAAISLSLVVIGTSVLFLTIFENGKNLMQLVFEAVSAFGTVGLSLGITGALTDAGKIVIVITMFIGRVSMLTLLVAFMRRMVNLKYKYPSEDVLIN